MSIEEQLQKIIDEAEQKYRENPQEIVIESMRRDVSLYLSNVEKMIDLKKKMLNISSEIVKKMKEEKISDISSPQDLYFFMDSLKEVEKVLK